MGRNICIRLGILLLASLFSMYVCATDWPRQRAAMVSQLQQAYTGPDLAVEDEKVLKAMRRVPRHEFVPRSQRDQAYADRPLPIGHGQTISQPYMVALMAQLARIEAGHKVLEIGTGSGYQAAVLADAGARVFTVEIIAPLAESAAERLERLGYEQVFSAEQDGYYGWPEHAPFDSIVVTAAAAHLPPPLIQQLKPGGRMVIPVGPRWGLQQLMVVEKTPQGDVHTNSLLSVRFVPLTGGPE